MTNTPSPDRARIETAFAELEKRGIIARADFECCTGCASYAIANQEKDAWTGDVPAVGAVHFNEQATDAANEGGTLYLGHGSFADTEVENLRVAELTCQVLREQGLAVRWNGDTARKILVDPPDGQRWRLNYQRGYSVY